MLIVLTLMAVGLLLGFVGAGGSGFIIAVLTTLFGYPIHTALGTALAAMVFSTLSGTVSHYREGNIMLRTGLIAGAFGAVGAWFSSMASGFIPGAELKVLTAGMLYLSGIALWIRMGVARRKRSAHEEPDVIRLSRQRLWIYAGSIGLVTGAMSGLFGIGSTPFIQIGLIVFMGMSVRRSAGTTMLIILPIALSGGIGYYQFGYLDMTLLLQVVSGIMLGTYIGAKFTKRVPAVALKTAMVTMPMIGATILLF